MADWHRGASGDQDLAVREQRRCIGSVPGHIAGGAENSGGGHLQSPRCDWGRRPRGETPPAIKTLPLASSVAVGNLRAVVMPPVAECARAWIIEFGAGARIPGDQDLAVRQQGSGVAEPPRYKPWR